MRTVRNGGKVTGKCAQQSEHERKRLPRQRRALERKLIRVRYNDQLTVYKYIVIPHYLQTPYLQICLSSKTSEISRINVQCFWPCVDMDKVTKVQVAPLCTGSAGIKQDEAVPHVGLI